jgi:tetratricopeptide (TPR) repeat protein
MTLPSRLKIPILFLTALVTLGGCRLPENPVSKEEALNLAHRIERTMGKHDSTLLNHIIDAKALAQRVRDQSGIFLSRNLINSAVKGVEEGGLGSKVIHAMGSLGTYQLVRQYEKDTRQHILFRLYGSDGVNYHDFELVKRNEEVKAADLYIYTSGENISKTLADALSRLSKDATNKDLARTTTIKELVDQGEYEKANEEFEKLPAEFRKEKAFQLIHVRMYSHFSNEKYIQALREYKSLFPRDPNMYLLMVDAYTLQKDYPKALESVDKLDSLIGKDPFQDYERGLIYKMMKDTANAQLCFQRLHAAMPGFTRGTIELVVSYLNTKQEDKAVQVIVQARKGRYMTPDEVTTIYFFHPGLKKLVDADSLRTAGK